MKNCDGPGEDQQLKIMNTSKYYQVRTIPAQYRDHQLVIMLFLHCRAFMTPAIRTQLRPGYAPSKSPLTDAKAIEAFEKALRATNIYHNTESYCRIRTCKYYYNLHCLLYTTCT